MLQRVISPIDVLPDPVYGQRFHLAQTTGHNLDYIGAVLERTEYSFQITIGPENPLASIVIIERRQTPH